MLEGSHGKSSWTKINQSVTRVAPRKPKFSLSFLLILFLCLLLKLAKNKFILSIQSVRLIQIALFSHRAYLLNVHLISDGKLTTRKATQKMHAKRSVQRGQRSWLRTKKDLKRRKENPKRLKLISKILTFQIKKKKKRNWILNWHRV